MRADNATTLRTRFVEQWRDDVPAIYDNQPITGIDPKRPYARLAIRFGVEVRDGFSSARQLGRVIVSVFVPKEHGDIPAYQLADEAASIFRNWSSSDFSIRCETPQTTVDVSDPDWFRVDVSTPWFFQPN